MDLRVKVKIRIVLGLFRVAVVAESETELFLGCLGWRGVAVVAESELFLGRLGLGWRGVAAVRESEAESRNFWDGLLFL